MIVEKSGGGVTLHGELTCLSLRNDSELETQKKRKERKVNRRTAGVFQHGWGAKAQKCETAIPRRGPLTAAFLSSWYIYIQKYSTMMNVCNATTDTTPLLCTLTCLSYTPEPQFITKQVPQWLQLPLCAFEIISRHPPSDFAGAASLTPWMQVHRPHRAFK